MKCEKRPRETDSTRELRCEVMSEPRPSHVRTMSVASGRGKALGGGIESVKIEDYW